VIGGGCIRRTVALVLMVALTGTAFLFRERLVSAWRDLRGTQVVAETASPELAAAAEAKLEALRTGEARTVALSAAELQSLLLFRYHGMLPGFLHDPSVELRGDRLRLRARVPVDNLPHVDGLGEAAAFLPDTTELTIGGRLLPLGNGRVAFAVEEVSAQRFPLPRRLVPGALERLGRRDEPGLPRDAMALPLPPGAATAYIRTDSLVLLSQLPATHEN
jgi:hypothetical protein